MYTGLLKDLDGQWGDPIQYYLELGDHKIHLNALLGKTISLIHAGEKHCVVCGRQVSKLFDRGYCFPCVRRLPETDLCQVKPEECHYDTCRDQPWGDQHCMIPTTIYLAKSSDIKVGISRNIPGRWINQGAVEAVAIAQAPTRKLAGEIEHFLATLIPDKTDWRKMLKGEIVSTDLLATRERILDAVPAPWREHLLDLQEPVRLEYPVTNYPTKVTALNLDKGPVEGELLGIKGSYLILSTGVLNVTKWLGYHLDVTVTPGASEAAR